ncbi:glutathione-dependent formaldehyde dehydrogenase [Alkalilimnicola ehrlichii]|uniref:zinc-dependent alcohol dehydrogenase n=1 Tax=Alkalilimnicola ehrlichii TaxID=351052 RepID=UPI000E2EA78F|nr:zinc-dependent alcohol dehydrogenase [Alkalilimnicola ehrlichii]RFA31139.1 glutathione-dependent formaldehyde dehydrogenase [Alkalilimnicola ehrlichii]
MRAVCWHGSNDVRVDTVPDPGIVNPRDAVVRISATAICGSDLHLFDGCIPTMQKGDVLGHEFMGEVVAVGDKVGNLKEGDRVVVPFPIACGHCYYCEHDLWSLCDNSNPNAVIAEKMWGYSPSGLFGYSHALGGYAGGQAEFVRVPFADVGPMKVPDHLRDEQVLFLTDIYPTGYQAAEQCNIQPGDTVAVWGCGPVGQFAIASAKMLGARVIAIDDVDERLSMAVRESGAEPLRPSDVGNTLQVVEALRDMTAGRGPDACIDAVGMEAHGLGLEGWYDRVKQGMMLETERPTALRQAIMACRKGGTVSVPGVYGGLADKLPVGALMNKALTVKTGQTHVHKYLQPLLERIATGDIDPSFVITHRMSLEQAPQAYEMFRDKQDGCIKVMLQPETTAVH